VDAFAGGYRGTFRVFGILLKPFFGFLRELFFVFLQRAIPGI
jgi:hypothetical protein